jgi:hypothetical protein
MEACGSTRQILGRVGVYSSHVNAFLASGKFLTIRTRSSDLLSRIDETRGKAKRKHRQVRRRGPHACARHGKLTCAGIHIVTAHQIKFRRRQMLYKSCCVHKELKVTVSCTTPRKAKQEDCKVNNPSQSASVPRSPCRLSGVKSVVCYAHSPDLKSGSNRMKLRIVRSEVETLSNSISILMSTSLEHDACACSDSRSTAWSGWLPSQRGCSPS